MKKFFFNSNKNSQLSNLSVVSNALSGQYLEISDTQNHDVFVVGYPKSGNTLMQHIIAHLIYGINNEISRSLVNLIIPDVHANKVYIRLNTRCFFKSHSLPHPNYKNVIYLIRDGRDALLSYYHMLKNTGKKIEISSIFNYKVNYNGINWNEHILKWESNPYKANILFLRYEDMITNKISVLNNLCDFLSLKRTPEELHLVEKFTSVEFMKTLEKKNDWKLMKQKNGFIEGGEFVRKGIVGDFKPNVDEHLIKQFEINNSDVLKRYNYLV